VVWGRYCACEILIANPIDILDRQQIASQWGLQLIFRMHNSDPTPQGVENRNILLWLKCVLTALHVNIVHHSCLVSLSHKVGVFLEEVICYFIYAKFAVMLGF
jgi:hypothetical protein